MAEPHEIKLSHYKNRVAQYEETIADLKTQIALLHQAQEQVAETPRRTASAR